MQKSTYHYSLFFLILMAMWQIPQSFAQCNQPMNNAIFQQQKNNIANQMNEQQRNALAKQLIDNNCLTSTQVKEICLLLPNDYSKLFFAKSAYLRTIDVSNFYEVYDSFSYFSTVFMLHDYVLEMRNGGSGNGNGNPLNNGMYPSLNYPNPNAYMGAKKCNAYLADNLFEAVAQEIRNKKNEVERATQLVMLLNNGNCFATTQIMKFATLLTDDNNRLEFLKKAYNNTFDIGNYTYANQVLNLVQNQNAFATFLSQQGGNTGTGGIVNCSVPSSEMSQIVTRIKNETFEREQLNMAKTIAAAKKCFTVAQVIQIVNVFTFSDTKIDIAKYMWDYTIDKDNFYKVTDAFTFSTEKEKILEFINSKK
ncbi:MAG: DUF4476 domain-containing protein [Cytophagales bacterium]|nr:MAG: DUF4476 domain-containing protein [Cytophagales bacterium]